MAPRARGGGGRSSHVADVGPGSVEIPGDHSPRVDPDHLEAEPLHEWLLDHGRLGAAPDLETAAALAARADGLLCRRDVVDDERDAWVGRDVAELLTVAQRRPADVDRLVGGAHPAGDREALGRAAGPARGAASHALRPP